MIAGTHAETGQCLVAVGGGARSKVNASYWAIEIERQQAKYSRYRDWVLRL